MIACRPEAHSRFTVIPPTVVGKPERRAAIRATLRLSSPAWLAAPKITSSIWLGSTVGLRSNNFLITNAARSSGRTKASEPPYLPMGVRRMSTMYAVFILKCVVARPLGVARRLLCYGLVKLSRRLLSVLLLFLQFVQVKPTPLCGKENKRYFWQSQLPV